MILELENYLSEVAVSADDPPISFEGLQENQPTDSQPVAEPSLSSGSQESAEDGVNLSYNPVLYWKVNAHRFPFLSEVAKDIFGIPASSGNIEMVFSITSDILCAKRNRLKPDFFEKLLFFKKNAMLQ